MPEELITQRVIRVPLVMVDDEKWMALRRLAYQCATFGNHLLNEAYAQAKSTYGHFITDGSLTPASKAVLVAAVLDEWKKIQKKLPAGDLQAALEKAILKTATSPMFNAYTEQKQELSSLIRDAIARECVGIWRRLGRKILRGEQTLGRFSVDRALVIRGRGVSMGRNQKDQLAIKVRLFSRPEPITVLTVWPAALKKKNNLYLAETLDMLVKEPSRITKASLLFVRPGRKITLALGYSKPMTIKDPAQVKAVFTVLADGTCRLTSEGRTLTLTSDIYRMTQIKEHFAQIHQRIKTSLGRSYRPRAFRRVMQKTDNFESWATGPVHILSRKIVDWCVDNGAGQLRFQIDEQAALLPWHALKLQVQYKGQEQGIVVVGAEKAEAA